jgi:cytochrome c biogenesis protein CcdA
VRSRETDHHQKVALMSDPRTAGPSFVRYFALGIAVLIVGLVGYLGFVIYPNLDLSAGVGVGLIVLASAAGIASFFSPCSFPLLVGMLGRPVAERAETGDPRQPTRNSLAFATALSLGVVAFLALLGTAIALGGDALIKDVNFASTAGRTLRITVGIFMILVGLIQLGRLNVPLRRFEPALKGFLRRQRREGRGRGQPQLLRFGLFGFAYLAAGFG